MTALKKSLGRVRFAELDRQRLISFGKTRARQGAGPTTVGMDFTYLKTVISHAAAVHGIAISPESIDLARLALKRLGIIGKGHARTRRPTKTELDQIIAHLESNPRQTIPMGRVIRFAVASAMRQDEICRIEWSDVDATTRIVVVRDRKDPRDKSGNDQKVPLLAATGFDAWALLLEQRRFEPRTERIFPYNGRSVEAASRLFEAGMRVEQVALVTGHRDWKMLQRYANLRPEDLHKQDTAGTAGDPSEKSKAARA